jgi:23S rRNA (cytosine1962-C5)-methyltransferase
MSVVVTLTREAEGPIRGRHPWVDAGMIRKTSGDLAVGSPARLVTSQGEFLAWAVGSGEARFPARVVAWDPEAMIGPGFFAELARASARRRLDLPLHPDTNAYRVVFGESDGLPGLAADRLGEWLVMLFECEALAPYRHAVADVVCEELGLRGAILRGEAGSEHLRGCLPPNRVSITEGPLSFVADPCEGQKTGWFCDQRDNRARVAEYAEGRRVLDVFAYSGGFSVAALARGARSCELIDSSAEALELARENVALNGVDDCAALVRADAFDALRERGERGERYGLVVLDPPRLHPTHAGRDAAERAYVSLNALGAKVVEPGGFLATFSCSGAMDRARFDHVLTKALGTRPCRIVERLGQPGDHPISLSFHKSEYLKGVVLQLG